MSSSSTRTFDPLNRIGSSSPGDVNQPWTSLAPDVPHCESQAATRAKRLASTSATRPPSTVRGAGGTAAAR